LEFEKMQDTNRRKIRLLRYAIKNTKQVKAIYRKLSRVFCPHILGMANGHWHVVVWQFEGYSNSGDLPNWRCFALDGLEDMRVRNGPWQRGSVGRSRRKKFPIDRIDTIADPDHIGDIGVEEGGFSLARLFFR